VSKAFAARKFGCRASRHSFRNGNGERGASSFECPRADQFDMNQFVLM
jgi:hypothetical protein